jgi:O-antigen/teichoic acid export membrane protein
LGAAGNSYYGRQWAVAARELSFQVHRQFYDRQLMDDQSTINKKVSNFSFDVFKLISGTGIAQVLVILAMPLLTRLYAPELFGLLSVFTGITSVLAVFVCMSYEYSIVLPERDDDAANLLCVSASFAILISLMIVPVIWIWGSDVSRLLNAPELTKHLWLLPLSTLFSGLFTAFSYWNSRTKGFGRLSVSKVTQSLATVLLKLGVGYAGYATAGAMVAGNVGGQIVATSILATWIWRDHKTLFDRAIRLQDILSNLKRYYKFPLLYTGSNLINTLSSLSPIFLFSYFFSPVIVGYYSLGMSALQVPMSLLGNSISQVLFQKVIESRQQGLLAAVIENVFRFLVAFGIFPIMMMSLIGRDLFIVAFGQGWAEAGVYMQMLAPALALFFVTSPLTVLTAALERQSFALISSTVLLLLRSLSILAAGILGDARLGILLFSLSGILVYGYRMFVLNGFAGIPYQKTARIALWGVAPLIPASILFWLFVAYDYLVHPWITVALGMILIIVYLAYLFVTQKELLTTLRFRGKQSV